MDEIDYAKAKFCLPDGRDYRLMRSGTTSHLLVAVMLPVRGKLCDIGDISDLIWHAAPQYAKTDAAAAGVVMPMIEGRKTSKRLVEKAVAQAVREGVLSVAAE